MTFEISLTAHVVSSELLLAMKCSKPFFSIVTVTYNDLQGLRSTYESILIQRFTNFEWLVVDGGSKDGTPDFLRSIQCPFLVWISEKDQGIYDAMNKGINMSSGDFVVFMNAGDVFSGEWVLQNIYNFVALQNARVDIVYGGATLVLPNGKRYYRKPRVEEKYIWHGLPANHQATYFSRKCLGEIMYDCRYRICGDYFIVAKFHKSGANPIYLDETLVDFRVGDTSHRNPRQLFWEPYVIQRDILKMPLYSRILSLIKRAISFTGVVIMSHRWMT